MNATAAVLTLDEDWQQRQAYLLQTGAPQGRAYVEILIHILDYLLKRYHGTAEAARRLERVLTTDPGTGVMRHLWLFGSDVEEARVPVVPAGGLASPRAQTTRGPEA